MTISELANLKGGQKMLWLRQHRQEVLTYHHLHGAAATCRKYHMKSTTLDSFLSFAPDQKRLGVADHEKIEALFAINQEAVREVKLQVNDLKKNYSQFCDIVSTRLSDKFFKPLLQNVIGELPADLDIKPDERLLVKNLLPERLTGKEKRGSAGGSNCYVTKDTTFIARHFNFRWAITVDAAISPEVSHHPQKGSARVYIN